MRYHFNVEPYRQARLVVFRSGAVVLSVVMAGGQDPQGTADKMARDAARAALPHAGEVWDSAAYPTDPALPDGPSVLFDPGPDVAGDLKAVRAAALLRAIVGRGHHAA